MKILRLLMIFGLALGVSITSGCSLFKNLGGAKKGANGVEATTTAGFSEDSLYDETNSANKLRAPYDQTYRFAFDKYEIKARDIESINVQANYLITHKNARVRLEGNADERGSREYNVALGWKRARAVAGLLKQQGVTDAQLALVSYGKEKPVAFGHDEETYSKNRRVELIYEVK